MNSLISSKSTFIARPAALALVLLSAIAIAPVYAGNANTCDLNNGNNNDEVDGGSIASATNAIACGDGATASGNSALAYGTFFDFNSNGFADLDVDTDDNGINDASSELTGATGVRSLAVGVGSWATGSAATAIGSQNLATGTQSTAIGLQSTASGFASTAVGLGNTASGGVSTAFGRDNHATGFNSTAFGTLNTASGENANAFGYGNLANGESAQAFGYNNTASGVGSSAIGNSSVSSGNNSVAVGGIFDADGDGEDADDVTLADGDHSAAFGPGARALSERALALGAGSQAVTADSVALGSGSIADRGNAISVGSAGNERQITNVDAGTQATDAANVGQMQAGDAQTLSSANAYTDNQIKQIAGFDASGINRRLDNIENRFGQIDKQINRGNAMSAALAGMSANAVAGAGTRGRIALGVGMQGGERAASIGYGKKIGDRASFTLGGAFSGSEKAVNAGIGFDL